MVRLSERMEALLRLCGTGGCGADVGCDHAYLSIRLVQEGRFARMIAMDLRNGPLQAAAQHIAQAGLVEAVECRLSDGLQALQPGEADTLICAGMGGQLMQRILAAEPQKTAAFQRMILQPQSDIPVFRHWLRETGFLITAEDIVCEDGKYYPMMRVCPKDAGESAVAADCPEELADTFGGSLLCGRHPVLKACLEQQMHILEKPWRSWQRPARRTGMRGAGRGTLRWQRKRSG
ncbi:MAG: SAM-dependent methyltransferase [Lachnospiraceae bacterium]|nr:SAM-dependent methyltransferase [Lachnospiraceae bacterium]